VREGGEGRGGRSFSISCSAGMGSKDEGWMWGQRGGVGVRGLLWRFLRVGWLLFQSTFSDELCPILSSLVTT
jgi:hypothetical protein